MAVTATRTRKKGPISEAMTITSIALDSSYPTGGEAIPPSTLGLTVVEYAFVFIKTTATTTVNVTSGYYSCDTAVPANNKLVLFNETPAEIADAADVAGLVVEIVAFGW
jgi:hypothetical protein